MRRAAAALALLVVTLAGLEPTAQSPSAATQDQLTRDLDAIFDAPVLARALVGVRIESLRTGRVLYTRNANKLVVPASNMKLFTMAVAAEKLGWDYRFETRLEAAGTLEDGSLEGDLIVTGSGDPSITSPDGGTPALFTEWAEALKKAGIRRVHGRIIGDDNAFDDEGWGAGWAWDYLNAGYAAPSGALSYNENVVSVRVTPGAKDGDPARIVLSPAGATFDVVNDVITAAPGTSVSVTVDRLPGSSRLVVSGRVPAGGNTTSRTTTIDNPTRFFVEALGVALRERGIHVTEGACDIDDLPSAPPASGRQLIAARQSLPLSSLGGHFLKVSQNFYGEMFLKAIARAAGRPGSAQAARQIVRETLAAWGIPADAYVMNDGSGLSRYDYVSADAVVTLLKHVWDDERLRGPFLAALPVGGHDGTLSSRMKNNALNRRVQAKTGTISNMRALSGFLDTTDGDKLVFSIIANHYTGPTGEIDAVAEKALEYLLIR
jgi:D-alanyl-D-alanine carboxypeptidase/D-alanyl-D-alanine-endopeptidase (penicillin-binding protein 4)